MLPLAGNEKFRVRGRVRVRVRSKNENDSGGPRERKPRPRRGSFLVAPNRSSIVLSLVLGLLKASPLQRSYGCDGANSGLGVEAGEGAGITGGGELVGLEVIFDFAWSILEMSD